MIPGAIKVESKGSYWWFDELNHKYMRLPKQEAPREKKEWGNEKAGVLQDAIWHDYESWGFTPMLSSRDLLVYESVGELPEPTEFDLKIVVPSGEVITAPYAARLTK